MSPNWSTTLRPDTVVGQRNCGAGGLGCVVVLAGAGFVVDDEVVDDLGVDVELVDVVGTLVVGLVVGAVPAVGTGVGVCVGAGVGSGAGGSAAGAAAGASATAGGSDGGGSDVHAGAHCTSSIGAAKITRRLGCLFICLLTFCRPPSAAWPRPTGRLPRTSTVGSAVCAHRDRSSDSGIPAGHRDRGARCMEERDRDGRPPASTMRSGPPDKVLGTGIINRAGDPVCARATRPRWRRPTSPYPRVSGSVDEILATRRKFGER